ncbi:MAG: MerR family transcriptional regulator [Burkholderiaceae bacterium]|nr:MerR family transcriptional regulator [Burkholderiaceae bacterium]
MSSPTTTVVITQASCLGEGDWLDAAELARACQVESAYIAQLVDEGLLAPAQTEPAWRFGSDELARLRRIQRLRADFDASLPAVALMLDLLDEVERLRGLLPPAGRHG